MDIHSVVHSHVLSNTDQKRSEGLLKFEEIQGGRIKAIKICFFMEDLTCLFCVSMYGRHALINFTWQPVVIPVSCLKSADDPYVQTWVSRMVL